MTLASTGGFVELAYDAAPGEVNDLQVGISAGTVTIIDQGALITVPAACTQANTHEHTQGRVGKDVLEGGLGNHKLRDRDGFRDLVRGGGGNDRARVDLGLDVTSSIETFF